MKTQKTLNSYRDLKHHKGITTQNFETYYMAVIFKTTWCWQKKQVCGSMEQNGNFRNQSMHLQPTLIFDQQLKSTPGQRTISSANAIGHLCMQKYRIRPQPYNLQKNLLKIDQRSKSMTLYHKIIGEEQWGKFSKTKGKKTPQTGNEIKKQRKGVTSTQEAFVVHGKHSAK